MRRTLPWLIALGVGTGTPAMLLAAPASDTAKAAENDAPADPSPKRPQEAAGTTDTEAPAPGGTQALLEAAAAAFDAGSEAFADGRYPEAVEHFERAESLAPHPATAYNLALALERAGEDRRAWALFRRLETEAPDPARREEAAQKRVSVERRIAVLRVIASDQSTVCVDGELWPFDLREARVGPLEPGPHEVRIDGRPMSFELVAGETRVVHMPAPTDTRAERRRPWVLGLGGGAAGTALAAGGLAGASALVGGDGTRRALAWGAAGTAVVSAALSTGAIVLATRPRRAPDDTPDRPAGGC